MAKNYKALMEDTEAVDLSYLFGIEFEPRNVKCVTTGKMYYDARIAAKDHGISHWRMKRHLDGKVSKLRNRLVFVYDVPWTESTMEVPK